VWPISLLCRIDYLIIGQGLAGTLIGYRLERAGHRVDYLDAPRQTAASSVAAGIVNPITGRRFVKSWRIDELLPEARSLYGELEGELGVKLWYDLPLVRTLFNRGEQNDWLARSADAGYEDYLDDRPELGRLPELTQPAFAYAGVRHSARVDVAALVSKFRKRLLHQGRLREEEVDYTNLPRDYERIIFCEGWRARFNPFFSYLPHGGNQGDVLIIKTEAPPLDRLYKHRVFLVPLADGTYWVGATSSNDLSETGPRAASHDFLRQRLDEVLSVAYEIVDHRAAVRPTVRDRRMIIGAHPQVGNYYIFNGLGTKGASLAPLGSRWLMELLETDSPVPEEVSIDRWNH
jgi:glycine/D-amino acid oxidase-like deaminating enzyme